MGKQKAQHVREGDVYPSSVGPKPWYRQKLVPELFGSVFGLIPLLILGIRAFKEHNLGQPWVYFSLSGLVLVAATWKYLNQRYEEQTSYNHDALEMACRLIRDCLIHSFDPNLESEDHTDILVATAYGVPGDKTVHQQLVPEIGGEQRSRGFHTLSWGTGAVGHAATGRQPVWGARKSQDIDAFRLELGQFYGLDEETSAKVRPKMWSWLAIPLLSRNKKRLLAVQFFDSCKPEMFVPELKTDSDDPGTTTASPHDLVELAVRMANQVAEQLNSGPQ